MTETGRNTTQEETPWHCLSIEELFSRLESSPGGLASPEAAKRLGIYGPNELEKKEKQSLLLLLLSQFANFLIIVLIMSAIISAVIGDYVEAIAIIAIVVLAGVLGFVQEYQADRAIESLRKMAAPTATVLRDGGECIVPSREIVPGDVLIIKTGDRIAADGRILEQVTLRIDEAALTGESVPVEKQIEFLCDEKTPLAERLNMVFQGTSVSFGRGRALVIATGMKTEFGKIAGMLETTEKRETPLQKNLDDLGRWLGISAIVLSAVIALIGILRSYKVMKMFIWGVALAVAVIPEALPAVVTISLALGVRSLVKRHVLIRKLPAVETLGATTIICSDKTGTLTQNEMTVREIFINSHDFTVQSGGKGFRKDEGDLADPAADGDLHTALRIGVLCNDAILRGTDGAWELIGDPTEGALIHAARKAGIDFEALRQKEPRLDEIPFSSERKRMTTVNRSSEGTYAYCKGAPEVILSSCSHVFRGGRVTPVDEQARAEIREKGLSMAARALRILAFAIKEVPEAGTALESMETDMIFISLVGMSDPPRPEVKEAIGICEKAGIKPIMITGDLKVTAVAVAKELNLLKQGGVLDGAGLETMSDEEFDRVAETTEVYARISPAHKLRIVDALMRKGYVVAMTGDGVNDAPALKKADIGIAMGITGTDVSKEASDMILTDDNFASIVAAVEEGRTVFENIRKYLVFLLSGNMGTVFGLVIALLGGLPLPLVAVQILFINLIMDGLVAIALGVEPPEPTIMQRPPRDLKEGIINRHSFDYIFIVGAWIAVAIISVYIWGINAGFSHEKNMALFFAALIAARIFNGFSCRSSEDSIFKKGFPVNRWLFVSSAVSILLTLMVLYIPIFHKPFQVSPLGIADWLAVISAGATVMIFVEIWKYVARIRTHRKKTQAPV